jgi:hypothetical protein
MTSKAILTILLLLSAILVLYPSVTSLIDIQRSFGGYGNVSTAVLKIRDNLILQIVGFVLLYLVLAFGLNFTKVGEAQNTFIQQEEKIKQKFRFSKGDKIVIVVGLTVVLIVWFFFLFNGFFW